ncbi:MAG TPA: Ig-like domain-containing protein [Kofleriaceae bacterium]|nr:Ig-like domain-containing protein [Kofleriaceae bacterium]
MDSSRAAAEPLPGVVWQNRVLAHPQNASPLTSVSHILYLNDCKNNSCRVSPGADNSLTNRSSIAQSTVTLPAYPYSDAHWSSLVACVRETFAPFDIAITTTDPGTMTSHFEVMIGGSSGNLSPGSQWGGVAPYIGCGATENNVISFVFPQTSSDLDYLCAVVAQEASHVWGLDHELNAKDPMTYLDLLASKRFQDEASSCGESLGAPRYCNCGGSTQNSKRYLLDTFGPSTPPSLAITSPLEGQWLKPGFTVTAELTSSVGGKAGELAVDGVSVESTTTSPFMFTAPSDLIGGSHAVTVSATDLANRAAMATVNVNVMAHCNAVEPCTSGSCLGGYCVPDASVSGGLGATCTAADQCITGLCVTNGGESLCTGACDAGDTCPAGFECIATAFGAACWPDDDDHGGSGGGGGGCNASGGASWMSLAFAAGVFVLARRRRRS